MGWLDHLKAVPPTTLQAEADILDRRCPKCGADRRGKEDRRPPLNLGPHGWHCHACNEGDDYLRTILFRLIGYWPEKPESREEWGRLRTWGVERSYIPEDPDAAPPPRAAEPEPEPIPESVLAGWEAGTKYAAPPSWMLERGLVPELTSTVDYRQCGTAFAMAMHGADGALSGVRFRLPDGAKRTARGSHNGLFVNDLGLALLTTPESWGDEPRLLFVCEGESDLLALAAAAPDLVLWGMVSGAWSDAVAARIPPGWTVLIGTDNDDAGNRYAAAIAASLQARVGLRVHRFVADPDLPGFDWANLTVEERQNRLTQDPGPPMPWVWPKHPSPLEGMLKGWAERDPLAEPPPGKFLLRYSGGRTNGGMMPGGIVAMLAGATNVGKTWAAYQLAISVATGRMWLKEFTVDDPGPVLLYLAESSMGEALRRIASLVRRMQLTEEETALVYRNIMVASMADRPYPERPLVRGKHDEWEPTSTMRQLSSHVRSFPYRLVVVDTFAIACPGVEESSRAGDVVGMFDDLIAGGPAETTCLLVHHTTKSGANMRTDSHFAARGHSSLVSAVKWTFSLNSFTSANDARWVIVTGIGNDAMPLWPRVYRNTAGLTPVPEHTSADVLMEWRTPPRRGR